MEIRAYVETDEDAVVELWGEVFPDSPPWNDPRTDVNRKLAIQRDLFLVATVDSRLVGTVMAGYDGHRGWVHFLAVSPDQRRKGIGAALMREVEQRLVQIGCPKLNLQVRATNEEVVRFYEKIGYSIEERVSMAKRLEQADG